MFAVAWNHVSSAQSQRRNHVSSAQSQRRVCAISLSGALLTFYNAGLVIFCPQSRHRQG